MSKETSEKKLIESELLKELDKHVFTGFSAMITKFKTPMSADEIKDFDLLKPYSSDRTVFTSHGSRDINLVLDYLVRFGSDLNFYKLNLGNLNIGKPNELVKLTNYLNTSSKLKELKFGLNGDGYKDSPDEIIATLFLSIAMSSTLEYISFQDDTKWNAQSFGKFCYATCLVPKLKYLTLVKRHLNYRNEDAIIATIRNGLCVSIESRLLPSQLVRILADYLEKARYWITLYNIHVDWYHKYLKVEIEKETGEPFEKMSLDMFERPKAHKRNDGTWYVTSNSRFRPSFRLSDEKKKEFYDKEVSAMSDLRRYASVHFQESEDHRDSVYSLEFGEYNYTDEQKKGFEKSYVRLEELLNEIGTVCEPISKEPHFVGYSGGQYIWPKAIEMNAFMFTFVAKEWNRRIIEIVKRTKAYQYGFVLIYE